jgi:hypothetical protein
MQKLKQESGCTERDEQIERKKETLWKVMEGLILWDKYVKVSYDKAQ